MTTPIRHRSRVPTSDPRSGVAPASAAMVRSVAGAAALALLILGAAGPSTIESPRARALSALSVASGGVVALGWWWARRPPRSGRQGLVALLIGIVLVANVAVYMHVLQTARPTALLMLVMLGAGILLVSHAWFGGFLVACVLLWYVVLPPTTPPDVALFYAFGLMVAAIGSTALHSAWVGRLAELGQLRRRERRGQEAALDAAARMAAGVGHDFNNLLTAVTGYADLILVELDGDHPVRQDVDEILKASESGRDLTDQLLALGRHPVVTPALVDVNEVVRAAREEIGAAAGPEVELVLDLAPGPQRAELDPESLREVITTLVYSTPSVRSGTGRLTLRTHQGTGRAGGSGGGRASHVHVVVVDPDAVLGPDELQKAFLFPRGTVARRDRVARATARGLVRQGGGFVFAEPDPAGGTAFHTAFPRADGADPGPSAVKGAPPSAEQHRGRGESVLLVEDEDVVRRLAERILTELGYVVTAASDGSEALRVAETSPAFDLVLSDVVMPGMSGGEVVRRLLDAGAVRRVAFMSGYAHDQVVHDAVQDPSVPFIAKPFTPGDLAREIRRVLDGRPLDGRDPGP